MVVLNVGNDWSRAERYINYSTKYGPNLLVVETLDIKAGRMVLEDVKMNKLTVDLNTVIKIGNTYILKVLRDNYNFNIWVQLLNKVITSGNRIIDRKDSKEYRKQREKFEIARRYNAKAAMLHCGTLDILNNKIVAKLDETGEVFNVPSIADAILKEYEAKKFGAKLKRVNIEARIDISELGYFFSGLKNLEFARINTSSKKIPSGLFNECSGLRKVQIIGNIEIIENTAFAGCTSLENLEIKGRTNVSTVGTHAFYGCENLEEPKFLSKVKLVGERAFLECKRFRNIEIANDAMISAYAFVGCENLESMKIKGTKASCNFGLFGNYPNLVISYPMELRNWAKQYHSFEAKELRQY